MKLGPMSSPMCPAKGLFFSSAQTEGSQPSCESEPHLNVCWFPLPVLSLNRRCSVEFLGFAFSYCRCVMPAPKPYSSPPSPKLCVTALLNNILCYKIGVFEKESAVSPISQKNWGLAAPDFCIRLKLASGKAEVTHFGILGPEFPPLIPQPLMCMCQEQC